MSPHVSRDRNVAPESWGRRTRDRRRIHTAAGSCALLLASLWAGAALGQQPVVVGGSGLPEVFVNMDVLNSLGTGAPPPAPYGYGTGVVAAPVYSDNGGAPVGTFYFSRPSTLLYPPMSFPRSHLTVAVPGLELPPQAKFLPPATTAPARAQPAAPAAAPAPAPEPKLPSPPQPAPQIVERAVTIEEDESGVELESETLVVLAPEVVTEPLPPPAPEPDSAATAATSEPASSPPPVPEPAAATEAPEPAATPEPAPPPPPKPVVADDDQGSAPPPPKDKADTVEPASAETEPQTTQTAAIPTPPEEEGPIRLVFAEESVELSDTAKDSLLSLAEDLLSDEAARIQLLAYASSADNSASGARRVSLTRALNVRAFLIDQGIRPTRMDVRALGDKNENGPADRVDILPTKR